MIPGGKESAVTSKNAWAYLFTVALVFLGFAFAFVNSAILIHESVRDNDTGITIYASITMMVFLILLILLIVDIWKRRKFVSTLKKSLFTIAQKNKTPVMQPEHANLYSERPNIYTNMANGIHANDTDLLLYNQSDTDSTYIAPKNTTQILSPNPNQAYDLDF